MQERKHNSKPLFLNGAAATPAKTNNPDIRSSAQGVFMIMTNGLGAFFGSYAAGAVVDAFGWPESWYIFAGYALVVAIVFAMVFRYKHKPEEMGAVSH